MKKIYIILTGMNILFFFNGFFFVILVKKYICA